MVLKNKKKHKVLQNNNVGVGDDKISKLPDAIIHHILSFLPTKCAMSTCILSKRWKYVSNSIPILDFRNWRMRSLVDTKKQRKLETKLFMNFLSTVLFLHEKPYIEKFYLQLDEFFDESRVNRWISAIVKHKVKEFGLFIEKIEASTIFPLSFFTCDSLTLLDLDFNWDTEGMFNIPNTVSLPKLKIIRLRNLSFVIKNSRKFFSNCPILEELSLSYCLMPEGLCIVNPVLKHLSVSSCRILSPVEISAPNLLTISYISKLPPDFVLNNFPSLVEAVVDFYIGEEYKCDYLGKVFVKLLEKLSSAKLLKICAYSFLVLGKADILLTNLPTFKNLVHLEFSSALTSWRLDVDTVRMFFRFLQILPNLKSIVFQWIEIPEEEYDECWALDPKSSLPHLKSIIFKKFQGQPKELNAVKLFLKYAGFLESVTIEACYWLLKDHQLNVMKLLLAFPRPADCVVNYSMNSRDA